MVSPENMEQYKMDICSLMCPQNSLADSSLTMGTVHEPQSPLMIGASTISVPDPNLKIRGASVIENVVASWAGGSPMIIRGTKAGRNLVFLNFYIVSQVASSGGWNGDGANLLRNALLFSLCRAQKGMCMSDSSRRSGFLSF
jgi:hypothetical protein